MLSFLRWALGKEMARGVFGDLVGSIDEGTSSARFVLFKAGTASVVCFHQLEIQQITPSEGWVEQDAMEILRVVQECIDKTIEKLIALGGYPTVSKYFKLHANEIALAYTIQITNHFNEGYRGGWCHKPTRNEYCMGPVHRRTTLQCYSLVRCTHIIYCERATSNAAR